MRRWKEERKGKLRSGWKMSLAQITPRASAQLACSLGHLTASVECHAKPFSQCCLPRAVSADSPVTGLQLFAELEWQLSHPSSWPGVYRFMLRSLLISEPVTERDKGPREVTHGDLSYLNLPRPSPQVPPVDQPTLSFPNQAWPSVTEGSHGSEHEIWSQAALGSTPRITESKGICIFAVERCCQTAKKAGPIYTLISSIRQCPFHTFSIFTNLFGKQNKKPSTTVLAFLSLASFPFFFFSLWISVNCLTMSSVHFKKFESSFHYLFVVTYYILWISTSIIYVKVLLPLLQWSLNFVVSVSQQLLPNPS